MSKIVEFILLLFGLSIFVLCATNAFEHYICLGIIFFDRMIRMKVFFSPFFVNFSTRLLSIISKYCTEIILIQEDNVYRIDKLQNSLKFSKRFFFTKHIRTHKLTTKINTKVLVNVTLICFIFFFFFDKTGHNSLLIGSNSLCLSTHIRIQPRRM